MTSVIPCFRSSVCAHATSVISIFFITTFSIFLSRRTLWIISLIFFAVPIPEIQVVITVLGSSSWAPSSWIRRNLLILFKSACSSSISVPLKSAFRTASTTVIVVTISTVRTFWPFSSLIILPKLLNEPMSVKRRMPFPSSNSLQSFVTLSSVSSIELFRGISTALQISVSNSVFATSAMLLAVLFPWASTI